MPNNKKLQQIIEDIYNLSAELEKLYPGRHFTPDGHIVGSLGEVYAEQRYGIELFPAAHKTHDGKAPDGRLVQIKATQRDRIALSSQPDYLIVLKINEQGEFSEVYNGPGKPVWEQFKNRKRPITGQFQISLSRLEKLNNSVAPKNRIPSWNNA